MWKERAFPCEVLCLNKINYPSRLLLGLIMEIITTEALSDPTHKGCDRHQTDGCHVNYLNSPQPQTRWLKKEPIERQLSDAEYKMLNLSKTN